MSLFRFQDLVCGECSQKLEVNFHSSINANNLVHLRDRIHSNLPNKFKLPCCGERIYQEDFFYREDDFHAFVIDSNVDALSTDVYENPVHVEIQNLTKEVAQKLDPGGKLVAFTKEFTTPRVVLGIHELHENLLANNNNIDDLILFLLKLSSYLSEPDQSAMWYLDSVDENEIKMINPESLGYIIFSQKIIENVKVVMSDRDIDRLEFINLPHKLIIEKLVNSIKLADAVAYTKRDVNEKLLNNLLKLLNLDYKRFNDSLLDKFGFVFNFASQNEASKFSNVVKNILDILVLLPQEFVDSVTVDTITLDESKSYSAYSPRDDEIVVGRKGLFKEYAEDKKYELERIIIHEFGHAFEDKIKKKEALGIEPVKEWLQNLCGWKTFDPFMPDQYDDWISLLYNNRKPRRADLESDYRVRAMVLLSLGPGQTFYKFGYQGQTCRASGQKDKLPNEIDKWIGHTLNSRFWTNHDEWSLEELEIDKCKEYIDKNREDVKKLLTLVAARRKDRKELLNELSHVNHPWTKNLKRPGKSKHKTLEVCQESFSKWYEAPGKWYRGLNPGNLGGSSERMRIFMNHCLHYNYQEIISVNRTYANIHDPSDAYAMNSPSEYFAELCVDYFRTEYLSRDDAGPRLTNPVRNYLSNAIDKLD